MQLYDSMVLQLLRFQPRKIGRLGTSGGDTITILILPFQKIISIAIPKELLKNCCNFVGMGTSLLSGRHLSLPQGWFQWCEANLGG